MHVTAIVLAAGRGLRFKGSRNTPKPIALLNRKPVLIYCLSVLNSNPYVSEIILAVNPDNLNRIVSALKKYRIPKLKKIVLGGALRQGSVTNALRHVDNKSSLVLVHDGVRPFIETRAVSRLIKEANKMGAAVLGTPVKETIKEAAGHTVKYTLDRQNLWTIQTPQVFKREIILKAYERFGKTGVTDDASLVEKLGFKVKIIPGSYKNIKITTREDLAVAKALWR